MSGEKKQMDFNSLFDQKTLNDIPVGECITSPDKTIQACHVKEHEWTVASNTDRFKGKIGLTDR